MYVFAILLAPPCYAQLSLDADLDRAAARYAPAATPASAEIDKLAAEAGAHYRDGRIDEAVAALDEASAVAFRSEATGRSFELSLTAAEVLRGAGRAVEAAERFQQAALRNTNDPRAAMAHQTAIETLAVALVGANDHRFDAYAKLLDQHLNIWPNAPSAESVRWRRVELLAPRKQWASLLDATRSVAAENPRYARSRELLVAAHAGLLAEENSTERFGVAQQELLPIVLGEPAKWPTEWSPLQREAALVLARSAIDHGPDWIESASQLLRQSLVGRPMPDPAWRRRAAATLVVASLAGGDPGEVGKWMAVACPGEERERQQLLAATHRRVFARESPLSAEADRLMTTIAALDGESTAGEKTRADALVDAGRDAEARAYYERLAAQRPDDRGVQAAYARLLGASNSGADQEAALAKWRLIESRNQAGSEGWSEARLERLRLLVRLGRREDAEKLLALTRLLAPASMSGEHREAFEQLEAEIASTAHDGERSD